MDVESESWFDVIIGLDVDKKPPFSSIRTSEQEHLVSNHIEDDLALRNYDPALIAFKTFNSHVCVGSEHTIVEN